jgi:hypothetical protein
MEEWTNKRDLRMKSLLMLNGAEGFYYAEGLGFVQERTSL